MATALRAARAAGDAEARTSLFGAWIDHIEGTLASKSSAQLRRYLRPRVWRTIGDFPVFRTAGPPFVAYTTYELTDGSITVVALAACYRFPQGGEAQWETTVIVPRLALL